MAKKQLLDHLKGGNIGTKHNWEKTVLLDHLKGGNISTKHNWQKIVLLDQRKVATLALSTTGKNSIARALDISRDLMIFFNQ